MLDVFLKLQHSTSSTCEGSYLYRVQLQNQMSADVVGHLRSISAQQSKIRGLRSKLQILREATAKQDTAVSHLLFVRRVPAVYRQCLAECMRRQAALV